MQRLMVTPAQVAGDQITLSPEQQHYLYRVLRLAAGDRFVVLDGQGQQWLAELTDAPGLAIATALASPVSSDPQITLAIALPKGSGFDEVVRQTTELGVTTLQPLLTARTLHQPNPKKLERWQRIAAEATEQSERLRMPTIQPPRPGPAFCNSPFPPALDLRGPWRSPVAADGGPGLFAQRWHCDGYWPRGRLVSGRT